MGYDINRVRLLAGGWVALAGMGGSFLANCSIRGAGTRASRAGGVDGGGAGDLCALGSSAACWPPANTGGASTLGQRARSVGVTSGYYLFNAAPYALTLAIIVATSSRDRALNGQPAELRVAR